MANKNTIALHHGHNPKDNKDSVAVPLHLTTAYDFNTSDSAAARFTLQEQGYIYTRLTNPTCDLLEQRLAAFEGGIGAVSTACGTGAITTTIFSLLKAGDHIVASSSLYGGTYTLLSAQLPRFGITTTFVDPHDHKAIEAAIRPETRAVYTETLGNPRLDLVDLKAIADIAHKHGIPLIVDNTVTPGVLRPIEHGADIVIHSLSKYICGNGTALGGAIIDAGNFDWNNGKFPEFTEPSQAYHGLKYWDAFGRSSFIVRARIEGLRDLGAPLSPANAWQIIQGLETLDVRYRRASENALALAKWLEEHPLVEWVNYPGLESNAYHSTCQSYLGGVFGGLLTFGPKGGYDVAKAVVDNTKLLHVVANIGDTKSLVIHPSSTTHQQLSEVAQLSAGVTPDLIRVSVGLEDIEDIKADIEQALRLATQD